MEMCNNTIVKIQQSYFFQYNSKFNIYCPLLCHTIDCCPWAPSSPSHSWTIRSVHLQYPLSNQTFWSCAPFITAPFLCSEAVRSGPVFSSKMHFLRAVHSTPLKHSFLYYMEEDKNVLNTLQIAVFANVRILTQSMSWISSIDFLCS